MDSFFEPKAWSMTCPKCRSVETSLEEQCSNCDSPSVIMIKKTSGLNLPDRYLMVNKCTNRLCQQQNELPYQCSSCGTCYTDISYQWLGPFILSGANAFCTAVFLAILGAVAIYFVCFEWLKLPVGKVWQIQIATALVIATASLTFGRYVSVWYPKRIPE